MPLDTPERVLAVLADMPRRITAVAEGASDIALRRAPAPGEWSANEVLAHLRACADVWGGCIDEILRLDTPTIRAINPRTYIARTDYPAQPFARSLTCYVTQRRQLLERLGALPTDAWSRTAVVTGAGRPIVRTVLGYAGWLASHERPHAKQIARAVGRP